MLPVYGLPILTVLLIVFFSLLLPDSFPTAINARSILSDKAIIALLSLAAMVPMMAGRIDLTIGFGIVMWHILAISLQVQYDFPWPLACFIVMLCGGAAGLINGVLVEVAQIDSFIATLGTGTILYALALWHTDGRQVIGVLPQGFVDINGLSILGVPMPAVYALRAGGGALGRHGANAARPSYLRNRRQREGGGAQRHSGSLPCDRRVRRVGTAGRLHRAACLRRSCRSGRRTSASTTCCRRWSEPFSGSTTIRPGRVNVWGTIVGVLILAVGISGIQQLGGAFFVEPLFNGVTLLVVHRARRTSRSGGAPDVAQALDCQPRDFGRCTHEIGTGRW